jgi:PAS domain S-box-containing protein
MKKGLSRHRRKKADTGCKVDGSLRRELRDLYFVMADIDRKVDGSLREELRHLYSVMELNLLIGQGTAGEELAWLVVTAIPSLLGVPFAALGLKEAEGGNWLVVGQLDKRRLDAATAQGIASLLAAGLASRAFSSAVFLLPADFAEASAPVPEPLAKLGLKSVLVAPVRTIAHKFGVVIVGSEMGENYTSHQRFLIGALANQMAVALENGGLIKQAQELEERYRSTLDSMLEGCHIIGYDWRFLYVNDAAARHWRQAREELLGHTVMERHPGIEHTEMFAALQRCMEKRIADRLEGELIFSDFGKGWFELSIEPVPEGIFLLSEDITERKQVEEKLRESEGNFRALAENSMDGILVVMGEGVYVYANNRAAEMLGYSIAELHNTCMKEVAHPDEFEKIVGRYRKRLEGKSVPSRYETVLIRKDGESVPVESVAVRTIWRGKPAVLVTLRDSTERKEAEEKLRESEERYRALVDTAGKAGEAIAIVQDTEDSQGAIVFVNEQFPTMLGFSPEELLTKPFRDFISPDSLATVEERYRQRQKGQNVPSRYEVMALRKDGTTVPVDVAAGTMTYRGKAATVAYWRDITDRKRGEEELRQSFEKLRRVL